MDYFNQEFHTVNQVIKRKQDHFIIDQIFMKVYEIGRISVSAS